MEAAMLIGQPIDRIDGRLKVTGAARYAAEFQLPGVVHGVLVLTTVGNGQVTGFDLSAAQGTPGVLRIITPENAVKLHGTHPPTLQDMTVYFNGQPIAVVVAERLEQAMEAAGKVGVRYSGGEPVTRMEAAMDQAYVPKHFRNGTRPPDSLRGDPDAAFSAASVKLEATYETPIENHNPMEPHATIAYWESDQLTVWHATQGVSAAQSTLASAFGIDPKNVRVIDPFVGGGFGCKGNTWSPAILAAKAAKIVGRPVKVAVTRAQMFTCNGYRPQTIQKLRFAADGGGRLVSMRHDGFSQMSLPALGEFSEPVGLPTEMLYACDNVAVSHRVVPTNASLPTYMRAPGESPGNFALESAIDELAAQLRMDPLEFRIRNYAERDAHENKPFASKALGACYSTGAAAFDWSRRNPAPRSMREGRYSVGLGMATSTYPTHRSAAAARVRMDANGALHVGIGSQDIGTGTYTVLAQIAAEQVGVPVAWVTVTLGDSNLPHAPVSGGSQTVASAGSAVLAAAQALRGKLFEMARTEAWGGVPDSALQVRAGVVHGPGGRVPIAELMARRGLTSVEGQASVKPGAEMEHYSMHAFGAQFAEVRVDPELGEIRVVRYVGAFDAGHVMNAKTARSQLIGGIVYGMGMALFEKTLVDEETGRVVNANISEYVVPVNADVPPIEVIVVPNDDRVSNPLGAKGIGELPMCGVAAAIANAVWHATGMRVRKVPIRVEDVLAV
jgi:xanthine dehydrogenase YagR molybdenum-binding subunit